MSPALYKMADRLGGLIRMVREGKDPILRTQQQFFLSILLPNIVITEKWMPIWLTRMVR